MTRLTGYDTGAVLEPQPWRFVSPQFTPPSDLGKVDFDNEESGTELTLRVVRNPENPNILIIEVVNYGNIIKLRDME